MSIETTYVSASNLVLVTVIALTDFLGSIFVTVLFISLL